MSRGELYGEGLCISYLRQDPPDAVARRTKEDPSVPLDANQLRLLLVDGAVCLRRDCL
jgi:hypothetical protein